MNEAIIVVWEGDKQIVRPALPGEIPELPPATEFEVRSKRNSLLSDCDWTQVQDSPVDKTLWATYRQALRDVTSQEGFPTGVVWPVKPE